MSSTNKTTNYELSQYVGADKPTYLGDYNSDMLKIDTQMKNNADNIASVGATATTANATANTALADASTAQTTANNANTSASNASAIATQALSKATANESAIEKLNSKSYIIATKVGDTQFVSNKQYYTAPITPLNETKKVGTNLSLVNNEIVVGSGVTHVLVAGLLNCSNIGSGTEFGLQIDHMRNGVAVDSVINPIIAGSSFASCNLDYLFEVEEGDTIVAKVYIDQNNKSLYVRHASYIIVEEM